MEAAGTGCALLVRRLLSYTGQRGRARSWRCEPLSKDNLYVLARQGSQEPSSDGALCCLAREQNSEVHFAASRPGLGEERLGVGDALGQGVNCTTPRPGLGEERRGVGQA